MSTTTTTAPLKSRKIVVLGTRAVGRSLVHHTMLTEILVVMVGKSSLTVQFVEKHFSDAYYPTIEYTYNRTLQLDRQTFSCEIVDTAGQDEFSILQSDYAVGVHGYMLVYSITSTATLELTRIIRDKILNLVGVDHVPMVLVGNKCDLNEKREVAAVDAAQLAKSWKAGWIETSAKTGDNIEKAFQLLVSEIEKGNDEVTNSADPQAGKCLIM